MLANLFPIFASPDNRQELFGESSFEGVCLFHNQFLLLKSCRDTSECENEVPYLASRATCFLRFQFGLIGIAGIGLHCSTRVLRGPSSAKFAVIKGAKR